MKKVRSSQVAIFVMNWVKHSFSLWVSLRKLFLPMSLVNFWAFWKCFGIWTAVKGWNGIKSFLLSNLLTHIPVYAFLFGLAPKLLSKVFKNYILCPFITFTAVLVNPINSLLDLSNSFIILIMSLIYSAEVVKVAFLFVHFQILF